MTYQNWVYDFKRTITSKSTIITAVAIFTILGLLTIQNVLGTKAFLAGNGAASDLIGGTVTSNALAETEQNMTGGPLLVSILTILVALVSFGNDKSRGILDSILAQPISRTGLVFSRYLSILCALTIASTASVLAIDSILINLVGSSLSFAFTLGMILAYFFAAASVLAIMFAIFYVVRSSALMMGIGLGIFALFLLWPGLVSLIPGLLGAAPYSDLYIRVSIDSYFLNPTMFVQLVYILITKWFYLNSTIDPGAYGVYIFSLIADAAIWLGVPLGILFALCVKKDWD